MQPRWRALAAAGLAAEEQYREVKPWGPVPEAPPFEWEPARVAVSGDGSKVYFFRRSDPPIWELDPTGTVLRTFGDGMFVWAHGLRVDPEGNIWATDASTGPGGSTDQLSTVNATAVKAGQGYQVFKFSPDGRVLMTLGRKGVQGDGVATDSFQAPTDVIVNASGDIFVTDGHGRPEHKPRVLKFRKDGTFVKAWGTAGSESGQFSTPHALAFDSKGRLFVADRGNERIQIFDQDGNVSGSDVRVRQSERNGHHRRRHDVRDRSGHAHRDHRQRLGRSRPWYRRRRLGRGHRRGRGRGISTSAKSSGASGESLLGSSSL